MDSKKFATLFVYGWLIVTISLFIFLIIGYSSLPFSISQILLYPGILFTILVICSFVVIYRCRKDKVFANPGIGFLAASVIVGLSLFYLCAMVLFSI